ncbi:MAG: hypothetical protein JRJ12_12455 [Deltaproteobacteria bacterium]|nr:hypothetical protein [Deltaproteobacteria bacterium]
MSGRLVSRRASFSMIFVFIILFASMEISTGQTDAFGKVPVHIGPDTEYAGNLYLAELDIENPTDLNVRLSFSRTYNSRSQRTGFFGSGWICDPLDIRIDKEKNGKVVLVAGDGQEHIYTSENGTDFFPQPKPAMTGYKLLKSAEGIYWLLLRNGEQWQFNTHGYLVAKRDAVGNELFIKRATDGITPIYIEGPLGKKIHFRVRNKRIEVAEGPGGLQCTYAYDHNGNLSRRVNSIGHEMVYDYYRDGHLKSYQVIGGCLQKFAYVNGLLAKRSIEGGPSYSYRYILLGSDKYGDYRQEVADEFGQIVRKVEVRRSGRERIVFDAQGNRTILHFDKSWRLVRRKAPIGKEERWNFSPDGMLASYEDVLGNRTTYHWSSDGRILTVTGPRGSTIVYKYELLSGLLESVTDQWGILTEFKRDARGRITEVIYDNNLILKQEYNNEDGYVELIEDVTGSWIYERDVVNRTTKIVDEEGGVTTLQTDILGRPVVMADGEGRIIRWSYDKYGRLAAIINGAAERLEFDFDKTGALRTLIDADGNKYRFKYYKGMIAELIFPDGTSERTEIDRSKRIVEKKDRQGQTVKFERDKLGRIVLQDFEDGQSRWEYNQWGQLVNVCNEYTAYQVKYNRFGDTEEIKDKKGRTIRYRYNNKGQRTEMIDPEGKRTSYEYDRRGFLTRITGPGGETYSFEHDIIGRLLKKKYPNGITATFSYDRRGLLSRIVVVDSQGKAVYFLQLTRDLSGKITQARDNEGAWRYEYDLGGRLVQVDGPNDYKELFIYDNAGNRISHHLNRRKKFSEYGSLNELLNDGTLEYCYNKNGQLESRSDGTTYEYNPLGQLIRVKTAAGKVVRYLYDPFGRLAGREVDGNLTEYFYDKEDVIAEYNKGKAVPDLRYVHGPDIDEPLSFWMDGKLNIYILGVNNDVKRIYDSNENIVQNYVMNPFGQNLREVSIGSNAYIFNARRWDADTGLYYFRARFFDPRIGRFISPDPIRFRGGWNLYAYANNDPVNHTDRFGLWGFTASTGGPISGIPVGPVVGLNYQYFGENDPRNGLYGFGGFGGFIGGGPSAGVSISQSRNISDDPYLSWEGGFTSVGASLGRWGGGVFWSGRHPFNPERGWVGVSGAYGHPLPTPRVSQSNWGLGAQQTYYVQVYRPNPNVIVKRKTLHPLNPVSKVGDPPLEFTFKLAVVSPQDPGTLKEDDLTRIAKWYWIDWGKRPHKWHPCDNASTCYRNTFKCSKKGEYGIRANYFSLYVRDPQENNLHGASAATDIICLEKDQEPPAATDSPKDRVFFSQAVYRVKESAGTATIEVIRFGEGKGKISVQYLTEDLTAKAGDHSGDGDYDRSWGILTWEKGDFEPQKFYVFINDDDLKEDDEIVRLKLLDPDGNVELGDRSEAILVIEDDDDHGTLGFAKAVYRVAEDAGSIDIEVVRTGGTAGIVAVAYETMDDSGKAGIDYISRSSTLTWQDGKRHADKPVFTVTILDNDVEDGNRIVRLRLRNATGGAKLGRDEAILIIEDNDIRDQTTEEPEGPAERESSPVERVRKCRYLEITPHKTVARTSIPDTITFTAIAVFDDGSQLDVTLDPRTTWKPGPNNTFTPQREQLFTESVRIEAVWEGCRGTAEITALTGPVSRADQVDREAPQPPADAYKWYAFCNKSTGEVTYGKDPVSSKHIIMSGPFPGPRTVRQWIEQNCPNWRCTNEGLCAREPTVAPPGTGGWYVLCNKRTGAVTIGKRPDPVKHEVMAGPFLGEPDGRSWINANCPNWRCSSTGICARTPGQGGEWYVLCSKAHGTVHLGKNPDRTRFWLMAGPFVSEPDTRSWVDGNCPSWRCDRDGQCFTNVAAEAPEGRPLEAPTDVIAMFEEREQRRSQEVTSRYGAGSVDGAGGGRYTYEQMMENLERSRDQMEQRSHDRESRRSSHDDRRGEKPPHRSGGEKPPTTGSGDSKDLHYFLVEVVVETESKDERCIETVRFQEQAASREKVKKRAKKTFHPRGGKIKRIVSIKVDGPYERKPSITPPPPARCTDKKTTRAGGNGGADTTATPQKGWYILAKEHLYTKASCKRWKWVHYEVALLARSEVKSHCEKIRKRLSNTHRFENESIRVYVHEGPLSKMPTQLPRVQASCVEE